jgi:hypothetical protein
MNANIYTQCGEQLVGNKCDYCDTTYVIDKEDVLQNNLSELDYKWKKAMLNNDLSGNMIVNNIFTLDML